MIPFGVEVIAVVVTIYYGGRICDWLLRHPKIWGDADAEVKVKLEPFFDQIQQQRVMNLWQEKRVDMVKINDGSEHGGDLALVISREPGLIRVKLPGGEDYLLLDGEYEKVEPTASTKAQLRIQNRRKQGV